MILIGQEGNRPILVNLPPLFVATFCLIMLKCIFISVFFIFTPAWLKVARRSSEHASVQPWLNLHRHQLLQQ